MARSQLHIRGSDSQFAAWENAAKAEEREIVDWARRVLDIVADSGLTIVQLRAAIHPTSSPPTSTSPAPKRKG